MSFSASFVICLYAFIMFHGTVCIHMMHLPICPYAGPSLTGSLSACLPYVPQVPQGS